MRLATLLATRLIPPVRQWLEGIAVLRIPELGFAMPVVYHPGFWLLASALSSAPVLGVTGERLGAALAAAGRQWAIATLAVAGFLCFSQVMFAAGMTARLAEAVAGVAGSAYLLVLPLIGGLGGFLRSEEHTSELQSLMRISYAVFCLKKKKKYREQLHEKDMEGIKLLI